MIHLTRLNHLPLVLNADLIESIEVTPDTVISLTTGQKLVVLEPAEEVVRRVVEFRRSIYSAICSVRPFRTGRARLPAMPRTALEIEQVMAGTSVPTPDAAKKKSGRRPDLATMGGLLLALSGILGGLVLEQGRVQDVAQLTAAIIVLGGTLGAVMVTTPMGLLRRAAGKLLSVFFETAHAPEAIIERSSATRPRPARTASSPWSKTPSSSKTHFCAKP